MKSLELLNLIPRPAGWSKFREGRHGVYTSLVGPLKTIEVCLQGLNPTLLPNFLSVTPELAGFEDQQTYLETGWLPIGTRPAPPSESGIASYYVWHPEYLNSFGAKVNGAEELVINGSYDGQPTHWRPRSLSPVRGNPK